MQGKRDAGRGEENFRLAQRHARTQMPWLAACGGRMCFILKQHKFGRCTTPARLCLARRAIKCQHSSHASQLVNSTPSRPIARVEVGSISVARYTASPQLANRGARTARQPQRRRSNAPLQRVQLFGTWTTHSSSDSAVRGRATMTMWWGC